MDELRKDDKIKFELRNKTTIEGVVADYCEDRVLVKIDKKFINYAQEIDELTDIWATVNTRFGVKRMMSCVISSLNKKNVMIVENAPTVYIEQKREYVRANVVFEFLIQDKEKKEPDLFLRCNDGNLDFGNSVCGRQSDWLAGGK